MYKTSAGLRVTYSLTPEEIQTITHLHDGMRRGVDKLFLGRALSTTRLTHDRHITVNILACESDRFESTVLLSTDIELKSS